MKKQKIYNQLFERFLDIGEEFQNDFSIPEFGNLMIIYTIKMLKECAPNDESFNCLVNHAIKTGIEMMEEEKGECTCQKKD